MPDYDRYKPFVPAPHTAYSDHRPMCRPVHEEVVAKELSVKGEIPKGLSGMYSRNGPNPQLHPTGGYHW